MLDKTKRKQFSNVIQLWAALSDYSADTPVYVGGCSDGYFHVGTDERGNAYITIDCVDLAEEYGE